MKRFLYAALAVAIVGVIMIASVYLAKAVVPSEFRSPVDTTAVRDSAMASGADVQMQSGLNDFDYFEIQDPSALVTQYTDTTIVYPIPPGSVIGIPHRYFEPVQRGNFY